MIDLFIFLINFAILYLHGCPQNVYSWSEVGRSSVICHCVSIQLHSIQLNSRFHCFCIIYLAVYFAVVNCNWYKRLLHQQRTFDTEQ